MMTLYFKIATIPITAIGQCNRFFKPFMGQGVGLQKLFKLESVCRANIDNYNEYTKNIITKLSSSEIYKSNNYTWDATNKTFNFNEIEQLTDEDYNIVGSLNIDFNVEVSVGLNETNALSNTFLDSIKKEYPCPDISTGFFFDKMKWNLLIRNIKRNVNTMLVGPTGTGKTDFIIRICKELGIDCHVYDMGGMQDPLTDLLGSHRIENGNSVFDYAKFVDDVQKPGVIVLDELSRAPYMTNNILFPCLDGRRTLPIEIAGSKDVREIKIHPECMFIATANIGNEYTGTNIIDEALMNRFMILKMDYLKENEEVDVLVNRTGIDTRNATKVVKVANRIRESYLNNILSKTISIRETLNCAALIVDGFSVMEALDFAIGQKFDTNNISDESDIVKKIVIGF